MTDKLPEDSSATIRLGHQARAQTNRRERMSRLAPLLDQQSHVVTRDQLRAHGWTHKQIDHELAVGRWQSPTDGLLVTHTGPLFGDEPLWVGVLHAGPGAVLSHLTGARRNGLRWTGGDVIDVLTPKGDLVEPLDGYFFHQTRRPYERWVKSAAGPPRLPLEHAVLLAAERDQNVRRAIGLLATSVQQRLTNSERLARTIPEIRKLRHGKTFRLVLGDIAGGAQSFAELDVGRMCRESGLVEPTRQAIRTDKEGRRRYLDCVWVLPSGQVVVLEVDGSFHAEVVAWWQDMRRERAVVIKGETVLRCSTIELRLERADVLADLKAIGVPVRCDSSTLPERGAPGQTADESVRRTSSSWPRTRGG
jgi:hypothetical protein